MRLFLHLLLRNRLAAFGALVLGAVILLGADVVGRVIAAPAELQTGIMTAIIGGPVFILIARRRRLAAL